jgi:hypothetical protein
MPRVRVLDEAQRQAAVEDCRAAAAEYRRREALGKGEALGPRLIPGDLRRKEAPREVSVKDRRVLDIGHRLLWGWDAASFAEDRLGFAPDPWQRRLLRSTSSWILLNCCRQSGKSTTTAIVALHQAMYDPGLVLLVSPPLRQSRELFVKVMGFLKNLEPVEQLIEDNKSSCELKNGSRIVSLPSDPDTVRGFSAPKLVIEDEAGYVDDGMTAAIEPMLAVSRGRLIQMSSPNGRRGHFYEAWQHGEDVERIRIVGRECPRISAKYLEQARRRMGPMIFSQEFEGEFVDSDTSAFSSELIELALTDKLSDWPLSFARAA